MSPHILALDIAGAPHRWINVRDAAHYYATDMIAWAVGQNEFVLRGGTQRATGLQSVIRASSIIAIKGKDFIVRHFDHEPTLTKEMLIARDRYMCAYCAQRFRFDQLDMEHIKDVILPGEMKEILNRVVEAEKVAQANLIKRREETAATRSLLNTARLMDENPTLLRLKELETLEKVTEKVDKLTVFGGLDGVLKDVVRIQVPVS